MDKILLLFLFLGYLNVNGQQVISESLGSVSTTTSISAHEAGNGFDSDDLTYSGTGDLRATQASPSGGANVFLTNTSAPRTFITGNLNTNAAVTSIDITFEIYKSISAANSDFIVDYTTDLTNYLDPQTVTLTTGAVWTTSSVTFVAPPSGIKAIRFRNNATTAQYRIDNIVITGNGAGAALPVTIDAFDVKKNNTNALITWKTKSEINNDYFEVLHSIDGRQFVTIANVKGQGNSKSDNDYQYTHYNAPIGINYYQLSQSDLDGKTSIVSEIKSVNVGNKTNIRAYPSQSADFITVENDDAEPLKIYDLSGKLYKTVEQSGKIDISDLPSGVYVLKSIQETVKFRKI